MRELRILIRVCCVHTKFSTSIELLRVECYSLELIHALVCGCHSKFYRKQFIIVFPMVQAPQPVHLKHICDTAVE
jgi:hypothetical protein